MFSIYLEYLDDSDTEKFLFFKNNKDFFADDIFSLKLNMELGQPGTLEALISPNNILNKMDYFKGTIIRVFNNNTEIWRGVLSKIETDYYGNKNVLFDGCLISLKYLVARYPDYLVIPYVKKEAEGYPEGGYMGTSFSDKDVIDHTFSNILKLDFYSYKKDPENIVYNGDKYDPFINDGIHERYSGLGEVDYPFETINNILNKYCLNKYGGYLIPKFHKEDLKWDVEYLSSSSISSDKSKIILEKKDLITFKKDLNEDSVITVILPFGKDGLTLSPTRALTKDQVFTREDLHPGNPTETIIIQKYGQKVSIEEFQDITSQDSLKYQADRWLFNRRYKDLNFQISFFDENILRDDENVIIPGDIVCYAPDGIKSYYTPKFYKFCKNVELDFLNPSKSEWSFGVQSRYTSLQYDNAGRSYFLENNDDLEIPLYYDESDDPS